MKFKKILAGMIAAVIASAIMAMPASAADIKADDNGVYGQAGIIWMIRDQWDHRKGLTDDYHPTDEMETYEISCTHKDVNITGNGQYTVEMSGYHAPQEWLDAGVQAGYLGVLCTLDFENNEDLVMELDEATIDGVTYTFEKGTTTNKKGEEERVQLLEDSEIIANGQKMIKIKNGYGDCIKSEPEMDATAWTTTEPITITFTISGLPNDKAVGFTDEVVEKVYGNGSIENDPAEGEESEEETTAESEAPAETTAAADEKPAETKEETASAEEKPAETTAAKTENSSAAAKEEEKSSSNTGLIVGICAAVVVIGAVCVIVAKKKK